MVLNLLQIILVGALFLPVKMLTYKITDEWGLPKWLDYKPFNCYLCLTFWTLLAVYLTIGLIFNLKITLFVGVIIAVLNAIAMYINQKNKTIKIDE